MADRTVNGRFSDPIPAVDPATLSGVELLKHEEWMHAHREALKGNLKPGIALGIYPPDADER